ncbi:MAG: PadR family transcriptional regulator [Caldilineaceae bacterium]|nr:PadR family transcriptional regulator [Caldilineaceae bacterium]
MKAKLEHYILGLLTINPLTGYDVKKYLDTEGRFARKRTALSQIYTTLKRMAENGLVTFEEELREGKADLKIYSITQAGRDELLNLLYSPVQQTFRYNESSIFFRVRYAFLVERAVIVQQLKTELSFRQEQIAQFRHRDRTIESQLLAGDQLAYVQAISNELHQCGAEGMDLYVAQLEKLLAFFEEEAESLIA